MSLALAVFASGSGSNLQALIDSFATPAAAARVALVVSDRADAGALVRAAGANIPTAVIHVRGRSEEVVAADTLRALEEGGIELVALAGYLRLVPAAVTRRYRGRMVNIHPALLPAFGGAGMYGRRVHEAVLAAGCAVSGATVHLVDERFDTGSPLAQWPVPVLPGDTAERLAARVLAVEHRLYPAVVDALARRLAGQRDAAPEEAGEPAFVLGTLDDPGAVDVRRLVHMG
jgi:formyltetrahydrofolate-dependent phosphoribosylglycinamide formyltransferase